MNNKNQPELKVQHFIEGKNEVPHLQSVLRVAKSLGLLVKAGDYQIKH